MRPDFFRSSSLSVLLHALLLLLVFELGRSPVPREAARLMVELAAPLYAPRLAPAQPGGGGDGSPLPPSFGKPPRAATRPFVPPRIMPIDHTPALVLEAGIVSDTPLPVVNAGAFGDPLGQLGGPPSGGPGSGGGSGRGKGGGIGDGIGPRFGGSGAGPIPLSGASTAPVLIHKIEPEFSEEARKAKFEGTVLLRVVIDESGRVAEVRVLRGLGMGLDERAVAAVAQWRFRPALRHGRPIAVSAEVEVNFRLL